MKSVNRSLLGHCYQGLQLASSSREENKKSLLCSSSCLLRAVNQPATVSQSTVRGLQYRQSTGTLPGKDCVQFDYSQLHCRQSTTKPRNMENVSDVNTLQKDRNKAQRHCNGMQSNTTPIRTVPAFFDRPECSHSYRLPEYSVFLVIHSADPINSFAFQLV